MVLILFKKGTGKSSVRIDNKGKSSICKMFTDDTLSFSKIKYSMVSLSYINYDLGTVNQWVHQWTMLF